MTYLQFKYMFICNSKHDVSLLFLTYFMNLKCSYKNNDIEFSNTYARVRAHVTSFLVLICKIVVQYCLKMVYYTKLKKLVLLKKSLVNYSCKFCCVHRVLHSAGECIVRFYFKKFL